MKLILTIALTLTTLNLKAQDTEAVKTVIDRLFEGMTKRDTAMVRSVFHPTARLQSAGTDKQGTPALTLTSIDAFVKSIGSIAATVTVEERLKSYEIKVDERLATAWTPYEFYVNGKLSHSGVDAFQLYKTNQGWKIIQISDTRKQ